MLQSVVSCPSILTIPNILDLKCPRETCSPLIQEVEGSAKEAMAGGEPRGRTQQAPRNQTAAAGGQREQTELMWILRAGKGTSLFLLLLLFFSLSLPPQLPLSIDCQVPGTFQCTAQAATPAQSPWQRTQHKLLCQGGPRYTKVLTRPTAESKPIARRG